MLFGVDKEYGLMQEGFGLKVVKLAEELQIPHLILYHTEEMHLKERKELYTQEGREYYHGKLFVPDDLEVFEL